jgi:hypothetical protein
MVREWRIYLWRLPMVSVSRRRRICGSFGNEEWSLIRGINQFLSGLGLGIGISVLGLDLTSDTFSPS